jgi:hypothetical protein
MPKNLNLYGTNKRQIVRFNKDLFFKKAFFNSGKNSGMVPTSGNTVIHFIPGLKIMTTFDWLKSRVEKNHIPGCC